MKVKETAIRYKTWKAKYTYQEYLELTDDGNRYKISSGDLIMPPAPNIIHQKVALKIEYELLKFYDILVKVYYVTWIKNVIANEAKQSLTHQEIARQRRIFDFVASLLAMTKKCYISILNEYS